MNLKQENLTIKSKVTVTSGVKNHSQLSNLDFNTSGHTGFASEEALNQLAAIVEGLGASDLEQLKQKVDEIIVKIENGEIGGGQSYDDTELRALISELSNQIEWLENYDDKDLRTQIRLIQMVLTSNDTDFDTLQELVTALKNNTSSIGDIFTTLSKKADKEETETYIDNQINTKLSNFYTKAETDSKLSPYVKQSSLNMQLLDKVDKENGKMLTSNDFTNEYRNKLDDAATMSQVQNYVEELQLSGTEINSIIDVAELPQENIDNKALYRIGKYKWSGTSVPNNNYVEHVYFNTELTQEEVISIAANIKMNTFGTTEYLLATSSEEPHYIYIFHDENKTEIVSNKNNIIIFTTDTFNRGFSGWNMDITYPIEINNYAVSSYEIMNFKVGRQNSELIDLFSTTPFVFIGESEVELYHYLNNEWHKIWGAIQGWEISGETIEVETIESKEVVTYELGTSSNVDKTNDSQIPTSKAVQTLIDNALGAIESLLEVI